MVTPVISTFRPRALYNPTGSARPVSKSEATDTSEINAQGKQEYTPGNADWPEPGDDGEAALRRTLPGTDYKSGT